MGTVELDDVAVFVAVGETASFSAAATRMGLPKSSVSRAIARLEASMDVALVHRTTRHVALSTAGKALYEKVAGPVRSIQQSLGDLPEHEEQPSGRLRVTAAVDFGATVLAEVAARFAARYPGVEIEAYITNQVVDLVAEGMDVALRISTRRLKDSTLSARKSCPVNMQLHASPEYLARRGTPRSPRDLDGHDWVKHRNSGPLRLEGAEEPVVILPKARIEGDDMFFLRNALVAGAGIGVIPAFLADADVAAGRLVRVLPKWNVRSGDLWIVSPSGHRSPRKVTAFVDLLEETLKSRALVPRP